MSNLINLLIRFAKKNLLIFFQIYVTTYVFFQSYINLWFSLNERTFFEFEKIIVINFFQVEVIFTFLIYKKLRNKNFLNTFKLIHLQYINDSEKRGYSKKTASVILVLAFVTIFIFVSFVVVKTSLIVFFQLIIGLNEIIVTNWELLISCLIYFVIFYITVVRNKNIVILTKIFRKASTIIYTFLISIPIFVILLLLRITFTSNIESSIISAYILSINISFLFTLLKELYISRKTVLEIQKDNAILTKSTKL